MAKRIAVPKTRCANTMSETGFWSFIRSALRQKSRWWKPISICKHKARRPYKGANKRQRFEYLCNACKEWFAEKNVQVDHVIPAGTLTKATDLPAFVENLFCEVDNLQVLCTTCHDIKTKKDKNKINETKNNTLRGNKSKNIRSTAKARAKSRNDNSTTSRTN